MIRPIRRAVSTVATAGLLAAALSGCSLLGGSSLDCSDLESAAKDHNLTEVNMDAADFNMDDYRGFFQWMADNGGNFSDADLGEAVKGFGEKAIPLFEMLDEFKDIDYTDEAAMAELEAKQADLETASTEIDAHAQVIQTKCGDTVLG
ncbi:hypothetical protein FB566_3497 [Stackebrandtia endophytica]|uniref:Lipoprotein n=1 Tax=Stackebrandtia endophytica TaxID=1496996 RepID=A0A543AZB5_9ACTN|nr:hypothetical protein [Stackebrandtia endophytica]TQL77923.1 hypothetical protein FB566_3497 [Stackebrandtia endophytica]